MVVSNVYEYKGGHARRYEGGQVVILLVLLLFAIALIVFARLGEGGTKGGKIALVEQSSKAVAAIADAALEDMIDRVRLGGEYDPQEIYNIGGGVVSVSVNESQELGLITLTANASIDGVVRKKEAVLARGLGTSFESALLGGSGGVAIFDTSKITGGIVAYSPIIGSGNDVLGDVTSIGEGSSIQGLDMSGDARASSISSSIVGGDAYYSTNLLATVVAGQDIQLEVAPLDERVGPTITSEMITDFKLGAEVINYPANTCPIIIGSGMNVVLGPSVIGCDLIIKDNANVLLRGPVWVKGNITIKDTARISIHDDLSCRSVTMVADNPTNRLSSSRVTLDGDAVFEGVSGPSCLGKSFIALVSTNRIFGLNIFGALANTYVPSISVSGTVSGDLVLDSADGLVKLGDDAIVSSISSSGILMEDSSQVIYQKDSSKLVFAGSDTAPWQVVFIREVQ